MAEPITILFAGGGTGGHLYPGIAAANALGGILGGAKVVFLCTQRAIDRTILEPTGFEFICQPIVPPKRTIGGLLNFWKCWRETKDQVAKILKTRKPSAVLGLGGYAAGVTVKLAGSSGIPAGLINPDVIPGKANQYLMRYVSAVCCQFERTRQYVAAGHREKVRVTGCPVRSDICQLPGRDEACRRLGLEERLQTLVVTGASLGAKTVNEGVLEAIGKMKLQGWQVLHLAGRDHAEAVSAGYREVNVAARVIDFTPAMADVWAVADLAVSRAGASSCAELTLCGVPSILMPYPYHKDRHQRLNGQALAEAGAAVLCDDAMDRRANGQKLGPLLEGLMLDSGRRQAMSQAARAMGKPRAAEAVATVITEMIGAGR